MLFGTHITGDGGGIHETITKDALSFLTPSTQQTLLEGQHHADFGGLVIGAQFSAANHFDGCFFQESAAHINALYTKLLDVIAGHYSNQEVGNLFV